MSYKLQRTPSLCIKIELSFIVLKLFGSIISIYYQFFNIVITKNILNLTMLFALNKEVPKHLPIVFETKDYLNL